MRTKSLPLLLSLPLPIPLPVPILLEQVLLVDVLLVNVLHSVQFTPTDHLQTPSIRNHLLPVVCCVFCLFIDLPLSVVHGIANLCRTKLIMVKHDIHNFL